MHWKKGYNKGAYTQNMVILLFGDVGLCDKIEWIPLRLLGLLYESTCSANNHLNTHKNKRKADFDIDSTLD